MTMPRNHPPTYPTPHLQAVGDPQDGALVRPHPRPPLTAVPGWRDHSAMASKQLAGLDALIDAMMQRDATDRRPRAPGLPPSRRAATGGTADVLTASASTIRVFVAEDLRWASHASRSRPTSIWEPR